MAKPLLTVSVDEVHVYWHRLDNISEDVCRAAWTFLDESERARGNRFVFAADRARYVLSHMWLRCILSRYADRSPAVWRFVTNQFGKPAVAGTQQSVPLSFSLTHTRDIVACAVAQHDVGIDVEIEGRNIPVLELASRYFSPRETQWLRECPGSSRSLRFCELWTLKEAYVKAIGEGLSHPLNTVAFLIDEKGSVTQEVPDDGFHWSFALRALTARHRLAVAVRSSTVHVVRILHMN